MKGNGRVARLFSRAYIDSVLEYPAIWSLARALARQRDRYYADLAAEGRRRQGDFDDRGAHSDAGLYAFCEFFLEQ